MFLTKRDELGGLMYLAILVISLYSSQDVNLIL